MSQATPPLLEQAFSVLQQGRVDEARELFESLVSHSPNRAAAWLGLAHSCASLGDEEAAAKAVDRALTLEPRNLRALLFKADRLVRTGEPRKSLAFYEGALRVASAASGQVPADIQQGLQRAQAMTEKFTAEYREFLLNGLSARGFQPAEASSRFNLSLDICLGRKQIFYQQPSRYYFPGLPQRQFYEREEFSWLAALEAATDLIREELLTVMADRECFKPYLQSNRDFPETDQSAKNIINNPDWGALYLWEYGRRAEENTIRFAQTMKALDIVPLPYVKRQLPIVLFSRLAANTHIPPHHGMLNTRLICHLPLTVPENCGALRCGSEQRIWAEGQTLIFDDSIEHEAWNNSNQERVVLLFDIWRPELTLEERELVTNVLEVVKEYGNQQA